MGGFLKQWTLDNIKEGIDRFIAEEHRAPTARDYDEVSYLPSARQIQRAYGGLESLRKQLGYTDLNFTKGALRKTIAINANGRGLAAEVELQNILIAKFGEPYVHAQARYGDGAKYRYDFLVYVQSGIFAVDVFATDRAAYIEKNLRHKITRYQHAPVNLVIYFLLVGEQYTQKDIEEAGTNISILKQHPNFKLVHISSFIDNIAEYTPLALPEQFVSMAGL